MGYMEWFYLGLFLVLLELFAPGVYLVCFGLAAFVTGALSKYYEFSAIEISGVFIVCSIFFTVCGWLFYSRFMNKSKVAEDYKYLNDAAGQHIGKTYTLSEDVDGRAKAVVGDSVWLVQCDASLKKGDKIKIVGVENGVILKATQAEK